MKSTTGSIQYRRPGNTTFVGDCMPFWYNDEYHLIYLLDENHHQGMGGLGGHQWAHAVTTDLMTWTHYPLALAIESDWEKSICTGSMFVHGAACHAFYATRKPDWTQHLGHAVSSDAIHFQKTTPNPFFSPPEPYNSVDCRDPNVFQDSAGRFHLLATAKRNDYPLRDRGGCFMHLVSDDLSRWRLEEKPFLFPGDDPGTSTVPECPDLFEWNGWFYLLFGQNLRTHYRMARDPLGIWRRPKVDILDSPLLAVMKTAKYGKNRRMGAGWLGSRHDNRDSGGIMWGGNLVLREIIQREDGTLATKHAPELDPAVMKTLQPQFRGITGSVQSSASGVEIKSPDTFAAAVAERMPADFILNMTVRPNAGNGEFGLGLRGTGAYERRVDLVFEPSLRRVRLAGEVIEGVDFIDKSFSLKVICIGDIIDVCIGDRRCLLNRLPETRGGSLFLFSHCRDVAFYRIKIERAVNETENGGWLLE